MGPVTVDREWTVIIPVKALAAAKTRMDPIARGSGDLALAFFLDTLAAVSACACSLRDPRRHHGHPGV